MPRIPKYRFPFIPMPWIKRQRAPYHRGRSSLHYCQDWAMPINTPIMAARDGVIIKVIQKYAKTINDPRQAWRCNKVVIRHDDGEESVYVHLAHKSVRVKVDRPVQRGEIIGYSGQTGYATYPHLHFGVYDKRGVNI